MDTIIDELTSAQIRHLMMILKALHLINDINISYVEKKGVKKFANSGDCVDTAIQEIEKYRDQNQKQKLKKASSNTDIRNNLKTNKIIN